MKLQYETVSGWSLAIVRLKTNDLIRSMFTDVSYPTYLPEANQNKDDVSGAPVDVTCNTGFPQALEIMQNLENH